MNQRGFANIVLPVVIVAIIAVGGYFVFVKKSEPVTQQPTTALPKNETVNWKIYQNNKYGFELKYPENFYITQEGLWGEEGSIDSQFYVDLSEYKVAPERASRGIRIVIGNFSGDFQKYVEEMIKDSIESANDTFSASDSINNVVRSEIKINNIIGYKVEGITGFGYYNIYFTKNGKIFSINNGIDDNLFKKILSTFKFIQ